MGLVKGHFLFSHHTLSSNLMIPITHACMCVDIYINVCVAIPCVHLHHCIFSYLCVFGGGGEAYHVSIYVMAANDSCLCMSVVSIYTTAAIDSCLCV